MVMVTLFCAVVGEGVIVPVEIEDDKSVGILKEAIATKTKYCLDKPHELTLYMAKENGGKKDDGAWMQDDDEEKEKEDDWMKDDDGELVQLQQATIPDDVEKMYLHKDTLLKTTGSIEDYFAGAPKKNVIHVLVQLPKDGVGVPSGERGSSESIDQVNVPSYPHPHRLERWNKINSILAKNNKKKARTNEEGFTTPYSSSRWTAVGPVFDDDRVKYVETIRPIPANDLEVLSKVLTWIMKCFEWTLIDVKDNEAKRLHVIAPILWAVVQLLPDVKIYIEEDLDGNRVDAHGHFEFVLMRGNKRVCIVEAKEEKFKQGMAQALLGCEVAADLDHSHEVYAVVTNVEKWIFLKSLDEEILCDEFNALTFDENGSPHEAQLIEVTGKLLSLLA